MNTLMQFQEKLDDVLDMLREARGKIKESDHLSAINQRNMTALEVLKLLLLPNKFPSFPFCEEYSFNSNLILMNTRTAYGLACTWLYTSMANCFFPLLAYANLQYCICIITNNTHSAVVINFNKCPSLTASYQLILITYTVLYIIKY